MTLFGIYIAAALLLTGAGMSKAIRPGDTARALMMSLPWPTGRFGTALVRALASAEAAVGLLALVVPRPWMAAAVAISYIAFLIFLVVARARGGPLATCGCFGVPDTPPTVSHLLIDLAAAVAACSVAMDNGGTTLWAAAERSGGHPVVVIVLGVIVAWLTYMVLVPLARLEALRTYRPQVTA